MPQPTCLVWTSCIRSSSSARSSLSWVWCSLRVSLSTCISSPSRRTLSLSRSDCNFSTTLILMHYGINHTEIRIYIFPCCFIRTHYTVYIWGNGLHVHMHLSPAVHLYLWCSSCSLCCSRSSSDTPPHCLRCPLAMARDLSSSCTLFSARSEGGEECKNETFTEWWPHNRETETMKGNPILYTYLCIFYQFEFCLQLLP